MSELTQIKSSAGVCKPSTVRTAKVDDSSMKKMLSVQWHKAMQIALENVFGWAAWKTLVTCCLWSQQLFWSQPGLCLLPSEVHTCSTLHGTTVTHARLLHSHFDFYQRGVFTVSAVPKHVTAHTPAVITPWEKQVHKYTTWIILEDSPVGAEGTLLLAGSCPIFYRKYTGSRSAERYSYSQSSDLRLPIWTKEFTVTRRTAAIKTGWHNHLLQKDAPNKANVSPFEQNILVYIW